MSRTQTLAALEVWMDAGLGQADWSAPLTWSLPATGAKALALARKDRRGSLELLGASVGAPIDFQILCRDIVAGLSAGGAQERDVAGLGRLAWAAVERGRSIVVLFALFEQRHDIEALSDVASIAEKCVAARFRAEGRARSSWRDQWRPASDAPLRQAWSS